MTRGILESATAPTLLTGHQEYGGGSSQRGVNLTADQTGTNGSTIHLQHSPLRIRIPARTRPQEGRAAGTLASSDPQVENTQNRADQESLDDFFAESPNIMQQANEGIRDARSSGTRGSRKNTKAAIRIASLNIRGFRSAGAPLSETKWHHVNQVIRDKKIGILLVQESHLMEERKVQIETLFGKRMKIFTTIDPVNPAGQGGVAVVLN